MSAILITLDTTNPGALDFYGKDRGLTPHLAGLAAESVVFDEARTVAPLTLPAHTSMLTGLTPPRHTVRDNSLSRVPDEAQTLAELAQAEGYATAAILSAAVLAAPYGLDQGFDHYDVPSGAASTAAAHMVERQGPQTTRAAQDWLSARDPDRPFFLWVHYFDPHAPYVAPRDFVERAGGKEYLGEVALLDQTVGDLLGYLRAEGLMDETAIVLAGDHGESLGRHGEPTHSLLCYDAVMRVPLLVRPPGGAQPARRDASLASVVDVAPTFQALLGLGEPSFGQDGRDLLAGDPPPNHSVYFESWTGFLSFGFSPLVGVVQGKWKYLHSSAPELYDLDLDPTETAAAAIGSADRERLQGLLQARLGAPALTASQVEGGADVLSGVLALGYAGGAGPEGPLPDALEASELPAPQRSTDQVNATYQAILLGQAGERSKAIEALGGLVELNRGNVFAATTLGGFLMEERRFQEARTILGGLLDGGHERPQLRAYCGQACEELGLLNEALQHFERQLELLPTDPVAAEHVSRVKKRMEQE